MISSLFYMLLALWIGSEGLIRFLNAKPGGLVVCLMGYGSFFVVQYYALLESGLLNGLDIENKNFYGYLTAFSLGLNVVGLVIFLVGFFRVQGFWTLLSGL